MLVGDGAFAGRHTRIHGLVKAGADDPVQPVVSERRDLTFAVCNGRDVAVEVVGVALRAQQTVRPRGPAGLT